MRRGETEEPVHSEANTVFTLAPNCLVLRLCHSMSLSVHLLALLAFMTACKCSLNVDVGWLVRPSSEDADVLCGLGGHDVWFSRGELLRAHASGLAPQRKDLKGPESVSPPFSSTFDRPTLFLFSFVLLWMSEEKDAIYNLSWSQTEK